MKRTASLAVAVGLTMALAPQALAQSQASAIQVDPNDASRVWMCNRDNDSVSVVDVVAGSLVAEIPVGVMPRTIAFDGAGTTAFVANQRGNIPRDRNFVTPFLADGSEKRGTISVIDVGTLMLVDTIDLVGTEPFSVVVAPNGEFMAVTGFRSGTVKFFDTTSPYSLLAEIAFDANLSQLPSGVTLADADEDDDFVADLGTPRHLTISADSARVFVSHHVSPWISVLDLTLVADKPTTVTLAEKILLDDYPFPQLVFDHNPGGSPVQVIKSQGRPRFLGDVALSPDGTRAVVPHLLANVNHDVNHSFGPGLAGDFANRLYPSVSVVDAVNLSFNQLGDASARLHHELSEPVDPAAFVPYGGQGFRDADGIATLGGIDQPILDRGFGTATLRVTGQTGLDFPVLILGITETNIPMPGSGTLLCDPFQTFNIFSGTRTFNIPDDPSLDGVEVCFQVAIFKGPSLTQVNLSNGLRLRAGFVGYGELGENRMGHRAGHPAFARWHGNDRVLMLNRGSEDLFLFEANGSDLRLMTVFPPRNHFVERAAFDTTTPMGDLPLGMAMVDDPSTVNDDSLVVVANELTRTVSVLRVDWETAVITQEHAQIGTLSGPDKKSDLLKIGMELFEDASRAQTAGRFNNSCGSCHFEGGDDRIAWQRPAGPRSTMPMYGGTLGTGRILWKSVRLNLGETGPMFGGENGGTGIMTDLEQEALSAVHEDFPIPLNPHIDQVTGELSALAALGQDLFHGTDNTGLNPSGRNAGCATCHPIDAPSDPFGETIRWFTADHVPSLLVGDPTGLESLDPNCTSLAENLIGDGFRNVNSGVDIDADDDFMADIDRNDDGIDDRESYGYQNSDKDDDFQRDDPNSWPCPQGGMMGNPQTMFGRGEKFFSVPTKLGVFASGPYFHDHVVVSLRTLLDPQLQVDQTGILDYDRDGNPANDSHPLFTKYSGAALPHLNKFVNEFHDIRGNNLFAPGTNPNPSKVQLDLRSAVEAGVNGVTVTEQIDADIEALLAYIESL